MSQQTLNSAPNMFPFLRYRDAPAAIDWLEQAFGFQQQMVVPGEDGTVAHAQLSLGPGVIMLGSARDDNLGVKSPQDVGATTQGIYINIVDPDAHYARAKASGANIIRELENTDYGSREYTAQDPEGHVWSFGTYRPGA